MKEKKAGVRLIQIVSLAILFGSALWTIQRVAMVSQINSEAVYWERARFFLGQGGASLYSGSSICSLGYSLILFPICALIKSPYAAYKAAILLNGIFLCGAYLCAVAAANKLFSEERKSFLSVACFFTVFCPALALSRTYTGPEMAVLLLTWFSVYLLTLLWERYRRSALILLTVSLCLIGFLQITALGMIIAIAVMLGFFVKKGKMEETSFLYCILALLLGLAAGNIAERVVISMFSKEMDITTASSSLEVFFDGISTGWENGYLYGLLSAITGKLYSVLAGTFLLACPALWNLCKCIGKQRMKKGDTDESDKSAELDKSGCFLPDALTGIFLIQLLFISIYDHSKGLDSGFLSLSGLEMVLSILVLIGLVQLKNEKDWEKTLCGYLLLFCVCTFATAQTLQDAGTGSISSENAGVLMLFQNADMTPVSIVYMAACVVLLISLLFTAFLRGATGKRRLDCFFRIFGCSAFTVLFAVANVFIVDNNVGTANETYLESVAPIASLLSETSADSACVYLRDGSTDREIILLQSLLPDQSIRLIANNTEARTAFFEELEQDTEDVLVLTGTSESNIRDIYSEALTGYEIVYLTKSYALWARTDSVICGGLENAVLARVETLVRDTDAEEEAAEEAETEEEETESVTNSESEVQTESETESQTSGKEALESGIQIYGGDVILTSGTYQADLYLQVDESEALSGVITVSDSSGTLCTVDFDETIFDENGAGIVSVQFTSRSIMRSVTIEVTGTAMTVATVEQFVYYKLSSAYTVGLGIENRVSRAVKIIKKLDKKCKTEGTVTWIDHHAEETEELSTNVFEAYLPGYEVTAALECEAESITSEYVIGMTVYHSWYTLMDRYSIVYRTSAYTVLVRNDSAQYKKYVKLNGNTLSNGTKINIEAFTGEASADTPISLEKGDYNYCVSVTCNVESLTGKSDAGAGVLSIMSGEELLAQKEITYADLLSGTLPEGENSICTEISIPLSLQVKTSDITCIAEMNDGISVTVQPTAIELTSQNYVYGRDESQLAQLLEKINSLDEEIVVNVLQTDTVIWNQNVDYTWLQEQLAGRTVEELSYSKANSMTEDTVLLTYGLFANILNLLNNYSIVGHAGKYTLWARNNGEALQELVESGLSILNSGKKLSLSSIAAMSGTSEMENVIESLPSAQYNVYLELTASDISSDDTIEVYLLRDKTENERSEDIDELIESGYTEEEASEWTDTQETCGSTTIGTYQINDSGKLLVTIKTSKAMELTNLTCEAYTWHNSEVEAKILWVEMVS